MTNVLVLMCDEMSAWGVAARAVALRIDGGVGDEEEDSVMQRRVPVLSPAVAPSP